VSVRRGAAVDWRDPLRMTVAAVAAFALARSAGLPEGHWAVLTSLIVTRPHLGATMGAAGDRLVGTLGGAALATGVASLRLWHLPEIVLLLAAVAPLAALVAWRGAYRTAPIAAVIVLSAGPGEGAALVAALLRVAEIALGAAIGAAVYFLLFRTDAAHRAERLAARLLRQLGEMLTPGAEHLDALVEASRAGNRALALLARTAGWDRAGARRAETLARLMARLHADIGFIVRVRRAAPAAGAAWFAAAAPLRERAGALAAALETGAPLPESAPATLLPDDPSEPAVALGFLLRILGRDLDALAAFLRPL
jgi:uncharacterized membrane protein YccC